MLVGKVDLGLVKTKKNKNTQPTKIRGLRSKGNIKYGILRKSSFGQLENLNVKSR